VDPTTRANRRAWEEASQKHVREYGELLAEAASGRPVRRSGARTTWGAACRYVVGLVPEVPLTDASADLVCTGKGALIWMPDLARWAAEVARLLRPSGHLFVYEAHPAAVLWTWDGDLARIRADRDYFGRGHVNDTFPARGAVEWQWRVSAAAWDGRLPNSFALLARRRALGPFRLGWERAG
jgi:SAM-dependent methyltransferase